MDGMHQITLEEWLSWKEDIRRKLSEAASNFVYIGFRLKQIRDSGMLDGAADIFEFALKEYGLGKSTTSRFIAINEKFSEGGNSLELRQEFKSISSSKLAEMLTLTDSECMLITEKTTVKEIRELKSFSRQQAPEGDPDGKRLSPLQKCMIDFFRGKKEILNAAIPAVAEERYKDAAELLNPSGHCTHKKGICFLFMEDYSTGVKVKLLTDPDPLEMTWKEMLLEVYAVFADIFEGGERDVYKAYYENAVKPSGEKPSIPFPGDAFPQENQGAGGLVATSQQPEKAEKDAASAGIENEERNGLSDTDKGKENPMEEAETVPGHAEKKRNPSQTEETTTQKKSMAAATELEEEPLPGQMEIGDYPDVIPDAHYEEIPAQGPDPAAAVTEETVEKSEKGKESGETEEPTESIAAGDTEPGLEEGEIVWMDIKRCLDYLRQWNALWDYKTVPGDILERAYQNGIDLAAGIEKLMNLKGAKNG